MEQLSDEDHFNLVADRIEAKLHGDVRVVYEKNYKGELHVEVQEIADEGDEFEDGWENITSDGYFTIDEKRGLKSFKEATDWLESKY